MSDGQDASLIPVQRHTAGHHLSRLARHAMLAHAYNEDLHEWCQEISLLSLSGPLQSCNCPDLKTVVFMARTVELYPVVFMGGQTSSCATVLFVRRLAT